MSLGDPSIIIQDAIVAALKADAGVAALVGAGVYDRVARKNGEVAVAYPYVVLGEQQILPELGEATDATQASLTLHAWSRAVGSVECKRICGAVVAALHDAELDGLQEILLEQSRVIGDPDGLTTHGIMIFSILTDAN